MIVLLNGRIQERSTEAAREYVLAARDRLRADRERYGDEVLGRRSYQRLEHSIMPQELANTWPEADLEVVLAD